MAGYIYDPISEKDVVFHVSSDPENTLAEDLKKINRGKRVMTLQLDGDELEAALWGLQNHKSTETIIRKSRR